MTGQAAVGRGGAPVVAVANQKGGVGKTTTAVNLAASLAATNRQVLLIDLDPQGNATMGCGVEKDALDAGIYEVLLEGAAIAEARIDAESAGFDVVGANVDLSGAELELIDVPEREFRLRQAIDVVREDYDFVLIDCPPSLSLLTLNGLTAASGVIIPMQCEYYALEGLTSLVGTIRRIGEGLNPELSIQGIVRTMYDPRNSLTKDVSEQLITHFGDLVYNTKVPRNVRLAEAPSFGLPILYYDKQSRGARAYLALAGEVIRRESARAPSGSDNKPGAGGESENNSRRGSEHGEESRPGGRGSEEEKTDGV